MKTLIRVALVLSVLAGAYISFRILLVVDAIAHGPYTTWYNVRCQQLALRAGLVGRPEADIARFLGTPSYIWDYDDPNGDRKTYNYDPVGIATGIFQVHCRGGVVVSLEQFDD